MRLVLRYHVPRSQVWQGSRGRQSGRTHLHVTALLDMWRLRRSAGEALCGRGGWYERPPEGEHERDDLCPRCVDIAGRYLEPGAVEEAVARVSRPRPDYDARVDHPERYREGPV